MATSSKNSGGSSGTKGPVTSNGTQGPILAKQGPVKPTSGVMGSSYIPGQSTTSTAPKGPVTPKGSIGPKGPKTTGSTGPAATGTATTGSTGSTGTSDFQAAQTQNRVNWKEVLKTTLTQWGLPTLIPKVQGYIDQGYTSDTAFLMVQNEPEYKTRFAGNEARVKAGLAPLSPDVYLSNESAYAAYMRDAGLPKGFYDDPATDFANFIGNNVSPTELQARVSLAADVLDNSDPMIADTLQAYYGLDRGAMLAHILDPQTARPFIDKQMSAAKMGVNAKQQGVNIGLNTAEQLSNMGISQYQAQQGFENISAEAQTLNKLSNIYGDSVGNFTQEQAIAAEFGGVDSAEAKARKQKLIQTEKGQFAGSSGTSKSSFAQQQTGQF